MTPRDARDASNRGRLLIDANLLLLYFVGSADQRQVSTYKRTRQYTVEDFMLLVAHLSTCREVIVTPHILTEVSNLAGALHGSVRERAHALLATVAARWTELHAASAELVQHAMFTKFGLTDTGIRMLVPRDDAYVLTDDLSLYIELANVGITVINFNHLRAAELF